MARREVAAVFLGVHSFWDWIGWVHRHPGSFFTSLGGLATGISTVVLAVITIRLFKANINLIDISNKELELNRRQFNRQFLSEPYEMIALLMKDTVERMRRHSVAIERSVHGNAATLFVMLDDVNKKNVKSKEMVIKLKLYPNVRVDPLVEKWMSTLVSLSDELTRICRTEDQDGSGPFRISNEARQAAIGEISSLIDQLEIQHDSVLTTMSEELIV